MPKCPGCEINYLWDWSMDTYRCMDGEYCSEIPLSVDGKEGGDHVTLMRCLKCKTTLSVEVVDDKGGLYYNHPDWDGVDFEQPENYWGEGV